MTRRRDGGWAHREERKGRGTEIGVVISLEMAVGTLGWDSAYFSSVGTIDRDRDRVE
jgi:hypothetical protein